MVVLTLVLMPVLLRLLLLVLTPAWPSGVEQGRMGFNGNISVHVSNSPTPRPRLLLVLLVLLVLAMLLVLLTLTPCLSRLQDMSETYMVPLQLMLKANVSSAMCSYNAINGTPSCANGWMSDRVLRQKWGFQGVIERCCCCCCCSC